MSEEGHLLDELLSIATEELSDLNKSCNIIKETDIFKQENNLKSEKDCGDLQSQIHKGDTDSSDDEENRSNEKKYNEFGRQIKDILQSSSTSNVEKSSHKSSWNTKVSFTPSANRPMSGLSKPGNESFDVFIDPIFGMRIVKPLISSTTLKDRMMGREAVSFARINRYIQMCDNEKDWVIAGVIANKSAVKTSQKGNQFCIWTLSDLKNDIKTVALFLFSKAHKDLWKTAVGTVIGILNPKVLDKKDGTRDEACLSVDNPQKVLIFGMSKDFGTCKSVKKNGEQCNAIVNKSQCEFCLYHIKQEYQKCSKRSELQANFAGRGLTALRNKVLGKNEVFYAGKSYMAIPTKKSKKLEIKDSNRLQSLSGKKENLILNKKATQSNKNTTKKKNAATLHISQAQKLRDMELLKKLGGCSGIETKNTFSGKHSANISLEESKNMAINVIDSLKSKNTMAMMSKSSEVSIKSDTIKGNSSPETLSSSRCLENAKLTENTSHKYLSSDKVECNNVLTTSTKDSNCPNNSLSNTYIDLNIPVTPKQMNTAKLNAIKFVQKFGGIKKVDPNSTKGSGKKRPIVEVDKAETASKKSKLAESEFISDRFKKMMEATSKHQDLIEMRHDEERDKYFKKLEVKERMEEKMINTHKVSCKAVRCLTCKYTSFSASDLCKNEKHPLKVFDAVKKFFKCGNCGNRTVTLEIIPIEPCKNCGSGKWQKAGMMKDKSLLTHSLSIRGGEQTFVNSVATDSNINLLVPE